MKWRIYLCHLCMLSILILCILQFKTNKKNVNDTRLPRCFSCLLVAVSHSSLIYIYISISNLDIWCLIDVFALILQWPWWEQAGVHQRHPALSVWGGHAFSPGKRSQISVRRLAHVFPKQWFWFIDWNCKFIILQII